MGWFTGFFSSRPPRSFEECSFEIERAPPRSFLNRWFSKNVGLVLTVPARIYNTYLLVRHREFLAPLGQNLCPMRVINPFRILGDTFNLTPVSKLIQVIARYSRTDLGSEGLFKDKDNGSTFLKISRDLFPGETIEENDSVLTCDREFVGLHRKPIMQFLTPSNIKKHGGELATIAANVIALYCNGHESINATQMPFTFTTTVISQLLLGHPGPMAEYQKISLALDSLNRIATKKTWHQKLSPGENQEYDDALQVIRGAIDQVAAKSCTPPLGSFVATLKSTMSDIQVKVALFNVFFAGSETAAALLTAMFWYLGQYPAYQEIIHRELTAQEGDLFQRAAASPTLHKVFAETIRLFPPGYVIGRRAAVDLICRAKDETGNVVFEQRINQGEGLMPAVAFVARDPKKFVNPDVFNPDRFEKVPGTLEWHPFGDGVHVCPGQSLAKSEVLTLMAVFISQFRFTSSPKEELRRQGFMTLKSAEEVHLALTCR